MNHYHAVKKVDDQNRPYWVAKKKTFLVSLELRDSRATHKWYDGYRARDRFMSENDALEVCKRHASGNQEVSLNLEDFILGIIFRGGIATMPVCLAVLMLAQYLRR